MDVPAFMARIDTTAGLFGCWPWTGSRTHDGYGRQGGRLAHRTVFEILVGPIPDGHEIDHVCFNRACCNPAHLRPLPASENRRLQRAALRTECSVGHPLTAENTMRDGGTGGRRCRVCRLAKARGWYAARQRTRHDDLRGPRPVPA